MSAKSLLHEKLAKIQGQLTAIPKTGKNSHSNYTYATEDDVLFEIRPLLSKNLISMLCSCVEESHGRFENTKGGITKFAQAVVRLTLTDAESGECIDVRMPGYAEDQGDKALSKAITIATKYAYQKAMAVASSDDPDAWTPPEPAKPQSKQDKLPATKPAPPTPAPPPNSVDQNPALTQEEIDELKSTATANGWKSADLAAYAKQLPGGKITFPHLQTALDYFSKPKAEAQTQGAIQ